MFLNNKDLTTFYDLDCTKGSEEAHTIQRETTPVYRLGATLSHPSSSGVSTSTTGIPPSGEQQHAADSGGNRGDQAEGDDSSSNQESPSQQEKGSGSWIALPNLLTKVFGADAQEAEPVSQVSNSNIEKKDGPLS